jgi:predicted TIM-barrel fold metal-dependent hydrolase
MSTSPLRIVSADDHMDLFYLPPSLWQSRLPARFREQGPRVVDGPDGKVWEAEGKVWGPSGRKVAGYITSADFGYRPGNPAERLADMDRDGVHAQVIYGHPNGFPVQDPTLRFAVLQAYNDWAAEFNRHDPDRLCVLPMLPGHDPVAAAEELRRVARLDHRGAQLGIFESPEPIFADLWEPLWEAAEETGLSISFHIGGGTHWLKGVPRSWRMASSVAIMPLQLDEALSGMIFAGRLERHPRLKIVLAEAGLGWLPYVVERLDLQYDKYFGAIADYQLQSRPSAQFAEQVYATFEVDRIGVRLIPEIGADRVMWASDYPHGETTWPESRRAIEELFAGLDPASKTKVVSENAARLYRIPI